MEPWSPTPTNFMQRRRTHELQRRSKVWPERCIFPGLSPHAERAADSCARDVIIGAAHSHHVPRWAGLARTFDLFPLSIPEIWVSIRRSPQFQEGPHCPVLTCVC